MNWLKYKKIYFAVSITMIGIGVYSLLTWGLNLGVDFVGGSIAEYRFEEEINTEETTRLMEEQGIEVNSVQSTGENTYFIKLPPTSPEEKEELNQTLAETTGLFEELRFESVGPSIGPELVKKTIYAIAIAAGGILLWVAFQFKSFKYGVSAILAMFHDSFILIGSFALLGHFMNAEIDFLFVTALLTTLSFSVHDTIVVYDRIREHKDKHGRRPRGRSGPEGGEVVNLANNAITETMVRSLNNSFTIVFMLFALVLLGGSTIEWFAVALFIGTVLGTYSSPFVAVPLLVTFDSLIEKIKSR